MIASKLTLPAEKASLARDIAEVVLLLASTKKHGADPMDGQSHYSISPFTMSSRALL